MAEALRNARQQCTWLIDPSAESALWQTRTASDSKQRVLQASRRADESATEQRVCGTRILKSMVDYPKSTSCCGFVKQCSDLIQPRAATHNPLDAACKAFLFVSHVYWNVLLYYLSILIYLANRRKKWTQVKANQHIVAYMYPSTLWINQMEFG